MTLDPGTVQYRAVPRHFAPPTAENNNSNDQNKEINKINRDVSLTFIPHLLPIISGIQSTIYINKNFDEKEYEKCLSEFFQDEPFIKIYKNNEIPTLKDIIGTNNLAIKVFTDYSKNKIIILSCLDNLIKGASGQAIQNMNIMFGFDEVESLI